MIEDDIEDLRRGVQALVEAVAELMHGHREGDVITYNGSTFTIKAGTKAVVKTGKVTKVGIRELMVMAKDDRYSDVVCVKEVIKNTSKEKRDGKAK